MLRSELRGEPVPEGAHADRGNGDDQVRRRERLVQLRGDRDAVGQPDPGQVAAVLAERGDLLRLGRVAGPEDDALSAIAGQDRREGRAPRARLEDRDLGCGQESTRGSAPRMIRSMFGRCRQTMIPPATSTKTRVAGWKCTYPSDVRTT